VRHLRSFSAATLLSIFGAHAQTAESFAVASVKTADPNERYSLYYTPSAGIFSAKGATLDQLISFAYNVRAFQIAQGPKWRGDTRFEVYAKAEGPTPKGPEEADPYRRMLRALLAERFHLLAKTETREMPLYELVVDKSGSKLKESSVRAGGVSFGPGRLTGNGATMSLFATMLSRQLESSVVDKTGLTGRYDFELKWQADTGAGPQDNAATPDGSASSIFTAIRADLGLRLQSARGPVEIVVIESVEKPTEN
jgi:uncharacterized protein (TIGR03435 family)